MSPKYINRIRTNVQTRGDIWEVIYQNGHRTRVRNLGVKGDDSFLIDCEMEEAWDEDNGEVCACFLSLDGLVDDLSGASPSAAQGEWDIGSTDFLCHIPGSSDEFTLFGDGECYGFTV